MRSLVTFAALIVALPALGAGPLPSCPSGAGKPDVAALVERTQHLLEGTSSVATMTMQIRGPTWSRHLKMKVWTKGRDYALVRVLEGSPRETGMMTLKRERQLWDYLPLAGRVMKLPSAMMGDSWMGSDFTNDDLVKGSSLVDDFTAKLTGAVQADGHQAWRIVLAPKPSSTVVWSRIELDLDRTTCLPVEQRFYDDEGKIARTLRYSDFRKIGARDFPTTFTVLPSEKGHSTTVTYDEIVFDVPIADETFSLQRLQRGR